MKEDNGMEEEDKKRGLSIERSKAGMKKRSPDGLSQANQNTIIMNTTLVFDKKWKKYNEIQRTGNKMDFNNQKIKNHPPSTRT